MTETVLVVGASGYLGRTVVARLLDGGRRVVGTYCSSPTSMPTESVAFDFWTDDLAALVDTHDVDAVVYAASVEYGDDADTGESDVDAEFARRAERLVAACSELRFVYVSSAAVFDGSEGRYDESAPRSPRDRYGRRLVAFEDAARERCSDAVALRTSYLFGFAPEDRASETGRDSSLDGNTGSATSLDHRLARTRERVSRGESVTYFTDMYKSPVAVTEAAAAIDALVDGAATGVVHAPTPRTSVYEFHRGAMAALGYDESLVEGEPIPPEMDVAPDRSLTSERFESVVGFEPSTVREALRRRGEGRSTE